MGSVERRSGPDRRKAELAQRLAEQGVVAAAIAAVEEPRCPYDCDTCRSGTEDLPETGVALARAVADLLAIYAQTETGSATADVGLGVALTATALLASWWWAAIAGAAVLGLLAWRRWRGTETWQEHVYGPCRRCSTLPIDCPTERRLRARRDAR